MTSHVQVWRVKSDHVLIVMNPTLLLSLLLSSSVVSGSVYFSYGNLSGGHADALQSAMEGVNTGAKEVKPAFTYDDLHPTSSSSSDSGESFHNEMPTLSNKLRRLGNFSDNEAQIRDGILDDYMNEILGATSLPRANTRNDLFRLKQAKALDGSFVYDAVEQALLDLHRTGFLDRLVGHPISFTEAKSILHGAERSLAHVHDEFAYSPGMAHLAAYFAFAFPSNCERLFKAFLRQFKNNSLPATFYLDRIEDPQNFDKIIQYMCNFDPSAAISILQDSVDDLIYTQQPLTCENIVLHG